nr:twin-arginine translocase TatA/TatE family subunit [Haladaptatus caseinilyticus]
MPGGMELAVILLIAVLLFGANKIPKLARSTGEAMGEFKKGRQEVETELREMQESDTTSSSTSDLDDEPRPTETETSTETNTESESGQ